MTNVVEFKPRLQQKPQIEKTASAETKVFESDLPIGDQAALLVINALSFYAGQGYDGGRKAATALRAMKQAAEQPQDELA